MNLFFSSNPGLKSRFNTFIEFNDYSSEQLVCILEKMCKENDYKIEAKLKEKLAEYFVVEISKKEDNFANGRLARNIYDDLVMNHARRVSKMGSPSDEDLVLLIWDDFTLENNYAGD